MNVYHKGAGCPQRPEVVWDPQNWIYRCWEPSLYLWKRNKYSEILNHLTIPTKASVITFLLKMFNVLQIFVHNTCNGFWMQRKWFQIHWKYLLQHSVPSGLHQSVRKEPVSTDGQPFSMLPTHHPHHTKQNSHNDGFDKGEGAACGGGEETGS